MSTSDHKARTTGSDGSGAARRSLDKHAVMVERLDSSTQMLRSSHKHAAHLLPRRTADIEMKQSDRGCQTAYCVAQNKWL